MAFKDRFPLPTLTFLGVDCTVTEWLMIIADVKNNKVSFIATCTLSAGGQPVVLKNCQFDNNINWVMSQDVTLPVGNFSLSEQDNSMVVNFSIPLDTIEPLLALPG